MIDDDVVAIGEIGLAGEVRPVSDIERRIKEGRGWVFRRFIISDKNKAVDVSSEVQVLRVRICAPPSALRIRPAEIAPRPGLPDCELEKRRSLCGVFYIAAPPGG